MSAAIALPEAGADAGHAGSRVGVLAPTERPSARASATLGVVAGVVTAAFYFIGASRSLGDIDGSATVAAFVKTPSMLDPLRRTLPAPFVFNDHPLFSLIEHAVWSSGLHSELALRVAPILFAAAAVGLLAAECGRYFGQLAGGCAAVILAANPTFAFQAREVRGYSLLVLCTVASTMLLVRLLRAERRRVLVEVSYVLVVAAGVATHFWFGPVLLAHMSIVAATRHLHPRWFIRWVLGLSLGLAVYIRIGTHVAHGAGGAFGELSFLSRTPTKAARAVLGWETPAVLIIAGLVGYALLLWWRQRYVLWPLLAVSPVLAIVWSLWPQYFAPRFLVWIVPFVGLAVAAAVGRTRWLAALVALAVVAMVGGEYAGWTDASPQLAQAAALVDGARAAGLRVCGYKGGQWATLAYTRKLAPIPAEGIKGCDVAVAMRLPVSAFDSKVAAVLPHVWYVPGSAPIEVFSRVPISELRSHARSARLSLDAHATTWP
jgi:hypothetical protein